MGQGEWAGVTRDLECVIMDGRRRQRDNSRRSQYRRPQRVITEIYSLCCLSMYFCPVVLGVDVVGNWQPSVPSWEKDFCKAVSSMDWETLVQMKKFTHLYSNVMEWNDSAGEEAFRNAKERYWAEINGHSCDISLPDPDLYIDKINWDSENDPEPLQDLESELAIPNIEEDHEPVVIFGDSIMPDQTFSPAGWGDCEENVDVPANNPSAECGGPWEQNWGNPLNDNAPSAWPVYSNDWGWSNTNDYAWPGYSNDWGWNGANDCFNYIGTGWSNANDHFNYVGTGWSNVGHGGEWGQSNDANVTMAYADRYMACYTNPRLQGKEGHYGNHTSRNDIGRYKAPQWGEQSGISRRSTSRKWTPINSCGPVGYPA
ncbi:hypothetical protein Sango_2027900 [Sesamum angolense]|uniref:Uncharacterized protein n=1 Tax=Sesamum angolense TaxID=2727404 RepID=A0AAE1WFS2_9LAMI|nr:hypothetical protein Sango_2027900 [Sesamum angolense]